MFFLRFNFFFILSTFIILNHVVNVTCGCCKFETTYEVIKAKLHYASWFGADSELKLIGLSSSLLAAN